MTRLVEFTVGMLTAIIVKKQLFPRVPATLAFVLAGVVYAASLWAPLLWQLGALFVLPNAVLIAAVARSTRQPRFLTGKLAVHLGELSFALYLVHYFILELLSNAHESLGWPAWAMSALFLVLSLAAARLLWQFVEVPANRFLRKRIDRRPANPADREVATSSARANTCHAS